MARKNPPFDPKEISVEASSPWSQAALVALARLGFVSYRLGLFLATLSVPMASGIAALPNEPNRLLSPIFVGIIPALAVLATWWTLYWVLRLAGAVCKLTTPPLNSFLAYMAHSVWDLIARFAKTSFGDVLGNLTTFRTSAVPACNGPWSKLHSVLDSSCACPLSPTEIYSWQSHFQSGWLHESS
jgi:hypothetical protein